LIKSFGGKFIPELKLPIVPVPFEGFGHHDFAQALINDYKEAGIPPKDVFPQSFHLPDILYWIEHEPEFGKQAILLDDGSAQFGLDPDKLGDLDNRMHQLYLAGVRYIGSPIWILLTLDENNEIIPSSYARAAKANNLKIIAWSLERDGPLISGGGWYHQSIKRVLNDDSQVYLVLDILARKVGVSGVFSDWPATVTYYANCMQID
jgi:glycerophosphoryl diester phosphodiesterase